MKILITGATGLVGGEIVRQCQKRDIDVHYLTTRQSKVQSSEGVSGFLWNPEKNEIDLNCFEGVSAIINLAGASISKRWTDTYKKKIISSRIDSLRTLYKALDQIDATSIKHFVSASAIGIYPNSLTRYYEEEDTDVDNSFLGEVVKVWEEEINTFQKFDFLVSKVRIGIVLSDKGGALVEMAKPIKNYVGATFGSGQQWQPWIHITDLAKMFLFIIENQRSGTYNGVGPNPVTHSKLISELAKVLKRPLWLPNVPQFFMKSILGEMAYLLFASQRVSSKKIEEAGFVFSYSNISSALEGIYTENNPNILLAEG